MCVQRINTQGVKDLQVWDLGLWGQSSPTTSLDPKLCISHKEKKCPDSEIQAAPNKLWASGLCGAAGLAGVSCCRMCSGGGLLGIKALDGFRLPGLRVQKTKNTSSPTKKLWAFGLCGAAGLAGVSCCRTCSGGGLLGI